MANAWRITSQSVIGASAIGSIDDAKILDTAIREGRAGKLLLVS